eukprot:6265997-Pyramimonas_sp.AAC.1
MLLLPRAPPSTRAAVVVVVGVVVEPLLLHWGLVPSGESFANGNAMKWIVPPMEVWPAVGAPTLLMALADGRKKHTLVSGQIDASYASRS